MRAGRHDFAGGVRATRWPFAMHELRVTPLIAPEFQASFQRILVTTRSYLDLERDLQRKSRQRSLSRR
jgi:hypothetical protein